ncbi:MAG: hypothetical protein PHQ89_03405 [Bacilli bacterium]|nr:hypothetical protein [Bacilli bacterium]
MIRRNTKSLSFLMEFIIVLFFFSLSSAICVSVFANAQSMNETANDKKTAIMIAQNYIESNNKEASNLSFDQQGKISEEEYFKLQVEQVEPYIKEVNIYHNAKQLVSLQFSDIVGDNHEE